MKLVGLLLSAAVMSCASSAEAPPMTAAVLDHVATAPPRAPSAAVDTDKAHTPMTTGAGSVTRLAYRSLRVGLAPATSTRQTWTLERGDGAVALELLSETGATGARLDGHENDASRWSKALVVRWEGRGAPSRVRLVRTAEDRATAGAARGESALDTPFAMTMTCAPSILDVRPAGATLTLGDACEGRRPKPAWRPTNQARQSVLACTFVAEGEDGAPPPLAFAARPVEWAFEDSDCAAQEGAFRSLGFGSP